MNEETTVNIKDNVLNKTNVLPGLGICMAVAILCMVASRFLGGVSPLLLAILLGAAARNTVKIPQCLQPGINLSAKSLLRWGVVLLGLQLSVQEVLALGPGVLVIVVSAVGITFLVTVLLGRALKVDSELTVLIAAGFSICGAAAVAGMQGVLKARDEVVAAAIALVVLFGTLMIPTVVLVVSALHLGTGDGGTFVGGAVHEVAQVVAAAGIAGGAPLLAIAVPIKLARVMLLAPMVAVVSLLRRRGSRSVAIQKRPPIIPLFVVGFIIMIGVATTGLIPEAALGLIKVLQQFLLTSAMFALGLGVHIKSLIHLGFRPVLLSFLATLTICGVVGCGILLGIGA
jgi:Predicted membrane protein